ncbi:ankyrin repeat-containing domain protein [Hypoxylon sp. FL1857]|nr:ankyrin repeat-containing domain protein [Hypoxylon sp. FL1857]
MEAKCNRGRTPLLQATMLGKDVVARTLLDAGARPDARDNTGRTALHYAVREELSEFFQLLLADERVDLNAKDHYGSTPLSIAVCSGFNESVARLLDTKKVDVDPRDNFRRTPFWWAIRKGYGPISKLLLDHAKREDVSISDIDVYERPLDEILLDDITCCVVCMQYIQFGYVAASCNVCKISSWFTQDTTNICTDCFNAGARCLKGDHYLNLWNADPTFLDNIYSDLGFSM